MFCFVFFLHVFEMSAPHAHMTRKELQKLLKDRGLASYGTRQQLVQRLLDGRRWFLKQSPNAAATSELTLELKFPVEDDVDKLVEKLFALLSINGP